MNGPTALCISAAQFGPSELFKRNRGRDVEMRLRSKEWIWEEMEVNDIKIHCMYKTLEQMSKCCVFLKNKKLKEYYPIVGLHIVYP